MTDWVRALLRDEVDSNAVILHLFSGPFVSIGNRRITVPEGSKRLLAFVALHGDRVDRRYAAGALWPDVDDLRASGNLRSSLWRLNRACVPLIDADKSSLMLGGSVVVDVQVVNQWAHRLSDGSTTSADLAVRPSGVDALELLPGWYDDWALIERDRIRQRMLHALELMSVALVQHGRCGEAVDAAMLAVTSEPLRESAQRTLIEAHIAEGNWIEAMRQFSGYRRLLATELDAEPHPSLVQLVRPVLRGRLPAAVAS